MHKYLILLQFLCCMMLSTSAQTLILRPSIGTRYFSIKPSNDAANIFDPTFVGTHKFKERSATIGLELLYKMHSYELVFTSQHIGNQIFSNFKPALLEASHTSAGGISQLQFLYNRIFTAKNKSKSFVTPFAGAGMGIGFNRSPEFYADTTSSFGRFTFYSLSFPNEFIRFDVRQKSLHNISYSFVLKAGIIIKRKNIERLRLQVLYNLGLNRLVQSNNTYYHSNTKYYVTSYSKGSQFSILLSIPIYLKRKQ